MALKCSHCPSYFCGFCYLYAGNWDDTHQHVRKCKSNPRQNVYAESEDIWKSLMRDRKWKKVREVYAKYASLTSGQKELLDKELSEYIN